MVEVFRKWLLKLVLGKELYMVTRIAADFACEEWGAMVTDPEMHKAEEDLQYCAVVRRRTMQMKDAWALRRFPNWEEGTKWLEGYEAKWLEGK